MCVYTHPRDTGREARVLNRIVMFVYANEECVSKMVQVEEDELPLFNDVNILNHTQTDTSKSVHRKWDKFVKETENDGHENDVHRRKQLHENITRMLNYCFNESFSTTPLVGNTQEMHADIFKGFKEMIEVEANGSICKTVMDNTGGKVGIVEFTPYIIKIDVFQDTLVYNMTFDIETWMNRCKFLRLEEHSLYSIYHNINYPAIGWGVTRVLLDFIHDSKILRQCFGAVIIHEIVQPGTYLFMDTLITQQKKNQDIMNDCWYYAGMDYGGYYALVLEICNIRSDEGPESLRKKTVNYDELTLRMRHKGVSLLSKETASRTGDISKFRNCILFYDYDKVVEMTTQAPESDGSVSKRPRVNARIQAKIVDLLVAARIGNDCSDRDRDHLIRGVSKILLGGGG